MEADIGRAAKVADLGVLDGPLLLYGGAYSNLQATRALIAAAQQHGIPATHCLCSGDIVGMCADPVATVAAIRGTGSVAIAGSTDRQIANGSADQDKGASAGTMQGDPSGEWHNYATARLGREDLEWLAGLPDIAVFNHGARRIALLHGGATGMAQKIWPTTSTDTLDTEISALNTLVGAVDVVISGRCGIAFARNIGNVQWVNAGAIGLPPHDGRPLTRYVILAENRAPVFHRLEYDHHAAAQAMKDAGLGQGYHLSLTTGLWPSEDTLPREMRSIPA